MKYMNKVLTILVMFIAITSCMNKLPTVDIAVRIWDNSNSKWIDAPDYGSEINQKQYIYGQNFIGTASPHTFTEVLYPIDPYDADKGDMVRIYSFDGKTWSKDSGIGNQTPFEGKIDDSINNLYAFYTYRDEPSSKFNFSWELVDPSQYTFIRDSSYKDWNNNTKVIYRGSEDNRSMNADLTKGMSSPITGTGRTVTNAPIPTRRGYKFLGWSRMAPDERGYGPVYKPESTFELSYDDACFEGTALQKKTLYAVWVPDYENGYWLKKDNEALPDMYTYFKTPSNNDYRYEHYPWFYEIHLPSKGLVFPYNNTSTVTLDHDFAIAEHELTGYVLNELRTFNNTLDSAERFSLPTITSTRIEGSSSYNDTPSDSHNYLGAGWYYNGSDNYFPANTFYPLTQMHIYQAYVICNAMTAYYNAHNGDDEEDLTYAYLNSDGTHVRTISQASSIMSRTPTGGSPYADITKTGFRLPTIQEWQFASRAIPKSGWSALQTQNLLYSSSNFHGSSFPQFQWWTQVSGSTEHLSSNNVNSNNGGGSASASSGSNYALTRYSSSYSSGEYPFVRGFYLEPTYYRAVSINSVYANNIGAKNMNGNVSELCGSSATSTSGFYVLGANAWEPYSQHYSSIALSMTLSTGRYSYIGMRTCRTITNLK